MNEEDQSPPPPFVAYAVLVANSAIIWLLGHPGGGGTLVGGIYSSWSYVFLTTSKQTKINVQPF